MRYAIGIAVGFALMASVAAAQNAPPAPRDPQGPSLLSVKDIPSKPAPASRPGLASPVAPGLPAPPPPAPLAKPAPNEPAAPLMPAKLSPGANTPADWTGSVMFNGSELSHLQEAMAVYDEVKKNGAASGGDFLSELNGGQAAAQAHQLPSFFLGSIIYTTPVEWSVFVNGVRLTAARQNPKGLITVTQLSPAAATLQWHPKLTAETWGRLRDSLARAQKQQRPTGNATANEAAETVTFTLKPNQTFFAEWMTVMEGKMLPLALARAAAIRPVPAPPTEVPPSEGEAAPAAAPAAAAPPAPSPASTTPAPLAAPAPAAPVIPPTPATKP